jgi:lipopolysaccharide cholinephosphotransferase
MGGRINDIKTIQKRGLQILLEVDVLCKKNNLKYFLEGGTLLGAVRHKGFIPWDDDVDIAMLREDYELFLKVAKKELSDQYFVQTNDSDVHFPFGFIKILDNNSRFPDNKNKFKTGFCIDIFPIDNAHDNRAIHKLNIFMIKAIQGLTKSKIKLNLSKYKGIFIKTAVILASLIGNFFSTRFLMKVQRKIAVLNNRKSTKNKCFYSYPFNLLDRLFPSELYANTEMLEFEGFMLPAPKGWDKILTILYGDYMTPPPMEERVPSHGFGKVQFLDK